MELPLIYPTDLLTSVKVGALSTKYIRLLSNRELRLSGEILYEVVSLVCPGTTPDSFRDISLVDANRIVFTAWRNTHHKKQYLSKQQCPDECGRLIITKHSVNPKYTRPDIYDSAIEFNTVDVATLEPKSVSVRLQPIPLKLYADIMQAAHSDDDENITEALIWCRVHSINGNVEFDRDSIGLDLYSKITDLVDKDTENTLKMFEKKVKCSKCGHKFDSSIFWLDAQFMGGK